MAVITIFRNPFSDESQQITVQGRITVGEAICFDHDRSIIFVNGFKRDHDWILHDDDVCLIREFPESGSSNPLTYVLAALNPVVFFSTMALMYGGDAISNALTGRGILENVANGLKKLLGLDDLSSSSDTNSLEKIPQLRGAKNQSGLDKPVPLILGTHLITPYYCGAPYTCIDPSDGSDGENQYFCALYCLGYSNILISDIKMGELLLARNSEKVLNGSIPISTNSPFYVGTLATLTNGINTFSGCTIFPIGNLLQINDLAANDGTPVFGKTGISINGKNIRFFHLCYLFAGGNSQTITLKFQYQSGSEWKDLVTYSRTLQLTDSWIDTYIPITDPSSLPSSITGIRIVLTDTPFFVIIFSAADLIPEINVPKLEIQQSGSVSLYPQKVIEEQLAIKLFNAESTGEKTEPVRFSAENPMIIELEVLLNGLIGYSSDGKVEDRSVQLKAQWRPSGGDESTWTVFQGFLNATSYDSSTGVSTFTRQKNKQARFITRYTLSYSEIINVSAGVVEIKLTRENAQGNDGKTSDDVYWSAIRTYCYDKKASTSAGYLIAQVPETEKDRGKTCRLGFRIKATDSVQGTLSAINGIVQSVARTWDGSSWTSMSDAIASKTVSNNPASVALLALQQPHIGKKPYADSELDMVAFGALYEFCSTKGYTCNGVLTSQQKERDLLQSIFTTCRSQLILKDGKYAPLIDQPRTYPVTVLNQQNTMSASNSKSFDELPDGLRIKFIDESNGFQTDEIYCMYDGKSYTDPDAVFQDVEFAFVTNRTHAWKLGRYVLACLKLRPETWTRKVSVEGFSIPIGSLVSVQDDTICVGSNEGGIIKEVLKMGNLITGILLDSYFDMITGYEYGVKIVQVDGENNVTVRTVKVNTAQGYTNQFEFYTPIYDSETVVPSAGDAVAFGEYSKITIDALVIGKVPADDNTFELALVPYDEGIYTADTATIPDFDSKTTKPLPYGVQEVISAPQNLIQGPKGATGPQGPAGTGVYVSITDPLETVASYTSGQLGQFNGYNYTWTATSSTTGHWDIVERDPLSTEGLSMYLSFDETINQADGSKVAIDNSGNEHTGKIINSNLVTGFRGYAVSIATRNGHIDL